MKKIKTCGTNGIIFYLPDYDNGVLSLFHGFTSFSFILLFSSCKFLNHQFVTAHNSQVISRYTFKGNRICLAYDFFFY